MADLIFKHLTIHDFKAFSGSHGINLEQPPGLYYISGRNDAAPELGANGVGKSTLFDAIFWCLFGKTIRDNRPAAAIGPWTGNNKTEVQLNFARGGKDYFVYRTRNPNSLRCSIGASDDDAEIQQEDIPKLLGMSEEMFRRSVILGQFGAMFLDLRPEQQSQMFTEALDLDVWLRAVQIATKRENLAANNRTRMEADIAAQDRLLSEIGSQITDAAQRGDLFETDRQARIRKIEKGIATCEASLQDLKKVNKPELPNDESHNELKADLTKYEHEADILHRDLDRTQSEFEKFVKQCEAMTAQAKSKKKLCNSCGQPIPDEEFKKQLAEATRQMRAYEQVAKDLDGEADVLVEKTNNLRASLKRSEVRFVGQRKSYDAALEAWQVYEQNSRAYLAEIQRQKSSLKQEQAATNESAAQAERLKEKRRGYRSELGDLKTKLAEAEIALEQARFWSKGFREIRLAIIDEALIELEMAASRHAAMLGLEDWAIKFDTERETQSGKVSAGFSVMLYPPGQKDPVKWESYSGGESQRWQLATSFALGEVLLARAGLSPNVEILDEPTRGLSAVGVSDLLDHLRDRALELGRAIYVVEHHSLDKGAFDGTLLVVKGKKGSSFKWL